MNLKKIFRKISGVECFPIFDMMHINRIIPLSYTEKDTHFLKSFYNSLTAKNSFLLLSVRDSATLEEE